MTTYRQIGEVRKSQPSRDGDGVAIQRIALVGDTATDPLLLLDELKSPFREDFQGGFPPHPHRGMQTLTYIKEGGIIHEDSLGHRGEIRGGGAQWMSAGSGVVHSEMPTLDTQGLHGFQLWFNLPASEKMAPPRYRDVPVDELAHHDTDGYSLTGISGEWCVNDETLVGPLDGLAQQACLLDANLGSNMDIDIALGSDDTAVAYVYEGSVRQQRGTVSAGHLLIATRGDAWALTAGAAGAKILVITGRPIGEPVVGYGPFVMNTRQEIDEALSDYQRGSFIRHPVKPS